MIDYESLEGEIKERKLNVVTTEADLVNLVQTIRNFIAHTGEIEEAVKVLTNLEIVKVKEDLMLMKIWFGDG